MTTSALRSEASPSPGAQMPLAQTSRIRRDTKLGRILSALATGRSLNRFDAERLGDHCLNTTISKIERHGLLVSRREEVVPGYGGHRARVMRYWLSDDHRKQAAALLGLLEN